MSEPQPALSVVVVTRDDTRTLQPILAAFGALPCADRIEMVIVAPDEASAAAAPEFARPFCATRGIGVGPIANRGRAAAAGVRAARGAVVALSENHCFPEPDWGERVMAAHAVPRRVGVGPAVLNANPERALSRVAHAAGYGMYTGDHAAGPRQELALHNSSFLREAVAPYGDRLESLLGDERHLWHALGEGGGVLWFDPSVRKRHINEATWELILGLAWCGGRRYGGVRSSDWSLSRRIAYGAASPLIALPVFRNVWRLLSPDERKGGIGLRTAAAMIPFALTHAFGEGAAYLLGSQEEFAFMEDEEFMIRERLGGVAVTDPLVAGFVAELDR